MYTFSSKLKTFSLILMAVGVLGIGYGFLSAPKDIQEVEALLASDSHGSQHEVVASSAEAHAVTGESSVKAEAEHKEHLEHVLHQLQNKPWAAFYVACIFFLLVTLGVLAFYAIQYVAQAGWSPVLFRVMQGITAYLPVGSVIFFVLLILCGLHFNHLFIWLDPEVVANDKLIANKAGYLNFPFWIIRAAIFLIGWNLYRYYSRKNCLAQDESNDDSFYKKNFKMSAGFLVFFIVTESIMSWDWIMSVDPHWFSTLFGWYVFSSFFVSSITVIALVTLYLKSKGYLEHVNTSHIHDLAKFEKQNYAGALKDYDICIRLDSKMAQAFVNRGIVKHKLEDTQGAIPDYDMAIRLNPDIAVAWLNRGIAKETLNLPGFESDFAVAEQLDPKFAQFRKRLNAEQEREKQRRTYGFVLPTANQNQNQKNPNQTSQNNPPNQAANQQTAQGQQQANQGQQKTTTNGTSAQSNALAQNNQQVTNADSSSVVREDGKGPITQKRSRRNIVVNDGGEVTETEITRGMVQNRNVNIELQPEFVISIFHKDSVDYERLQYYSMEIDALNRKNNNQPFMLITNKPVGSDDWRSEEYNENISLLDKSIQTGRKSSDAYFNRAMFYELLKNYNQAIEDYDKAIKTDGRNILAYFSRANTMTKRVDFIRMPGLLPEPTTLNISGTKAGTDAPKEEKILDYEDIIKDYESILYMNPRFIFAWFNMGNTKVKKKDYLGAINDYSKAIDLEPDFAEAFFNRGLTRIYLNDLEGGSVDLSKAGELGLIEAYNVIKRYCN